MTADARTVVHDAISGLLDDGEIAVAWVLVIDVAGPDDTRYLAHRVGAGVDGSDYPMAWHAVGMLTASLDAARDQVREMTTTDDDDQEEEEDD